MLISVLCSNFASKDGPFPWEKFLTKLDAGSAARLQLMLPVLVRAMQPIHEGGLFLRRLGATCSSCRDTVSAAHDMWEVTHSTWNLPPEGVRGAGQGTGDTFWSQSLSPLVAPQALTIATFCSEPGETFEDVPRARPCALP